MVLITRPPLRAVELANHIDGEGVAELVEQPSGSADVRKHHGVGPG